jgi:hypothetical protein
MVNNQSGGLKQLNTIIFKIGYVDVPGGINGNTAWVIELPVPILPGVRIRFARCGSTIESNAGVWAPRPNMTTICAADTSPSPTRKNTTNKLHNTLVLEVGYVHVSGTINGNAPRPTELPVT